MEQVKNSLRSLTQRICRELERQEIAKRPVWTVNETEMELAVLAKRLDALDAEIDSAGWGINNSAPTENFPWVNDEMVVDGEIRRYRRTRTKIELKIAEKKLELYKLGGDPNGLASDEPSNHDEGVA